MWTIIRWGIYIFIGFVILKLIGQLLAKYVLIPIIMVIGIFILGWISDGFWNGVIGAVLLSVGLLFVIGIGVDDDDDTSTSNCDKRRRGGGRTRTPRSTPQNKDSDSAAIRAKNEKLQSLGYRIDDAERELGYIERDLRDAESNLGHAERKLDSFRNTCYPDEFTERNIRETEWEIRQYASEVRSIESRLDYAEKKLNDLNSQYNHIEKFG